MRGDPTMATLLDDGVVENCLDDPISLLDRGQLMVIDVDEIDAMIEDPGYILNETPQTLNRSSITSTSEVYTSSYRKRSVALPVTFFDISRNISLLMKCRPISIKIVDCDIYPWYYKKFKHIIKNNNVISVEEEDFSQSKLINDCAVLSSSNDTCDKDTILGAKDKINLSSEQRAKVLKLSNEIENLANVNEENKNITYSEKDPLKYNESLSLSNNNISGYGFDKHPNDLLTYKTIAQSIVRNIYHNDVTTKTDNICIQNPKISGSSEISIDIKSQKMYRTNMRKKNEAREKVLTSPILPCTVKPQKKAKRKNSNNNNVLRNSFKANNILEKCSDKNKACEKYMSAINKVLPHYHCGGPVSTNNNSNIYFSNNFDNEIQSQDLITYNMSPHWHQPFKKNDVIVDNSDSTLTQHSNNSTGRLVLSPNSTTEISYMGINQTLYNNPPITSQVTRQQGFENVNDTPIFQRSYHYPDLYYQNNIHSPTGYPNSIKENGNSLRHIRRPSAKQISGVNHRIYSQPSNLGTDESYTQKSLCLLNEYVNYSRTQVPLQRTGSNVNISQSNPLLTRLLNCNKLSECYKSTFEKHSGLGPRTIMERNSYPSMGPNVWLPTRPPPPRPIYQDYLSLRQYNQDENIQFQNAGMHLNGFSNYEAISRQHKIYQTQMNPAELTNYSPQNIPIGVSRFANPILSGNNSIERNICTHTVRNLVSNGPCDANVRIDVNIKANNQNNINTAIEHNKTKDIKISNKNNIHDIIDELSNRKSNCLYSKLHHVTLKQVSFSNKNELNPTEQHVVNTKGYSPPILPIPSFKKSLELLSEPQHSPALNSKESSNLKLASSENVCDAIKKARLSQEYSNISRKRKLNEEEKMYINITKRTCKNAK